MGERGPPPIEPPRLELGALRAALLAIDETRDDLLRLAAQVVALTDELEQRSDDPELAARLAQRTQAALDQIRLTDAERPGRLHLGDFADKYAIETEDGPPCRELLALCEARCCTFSFALSSQDLDEGRIRWDHGQPYLIRHGSDGYCSHHHRDHTCSAYAHRPATCRTYDCRTDPRVWADYDRRRVAPRPTSPDVADPTFVRMDRLRRRDVALAGESWSLRKR